MATRRLFQFGFIALIVAIGIAIGVAFIVSSRAVDEDSEALARIRRVPRREYLAPLRSTLTSVAELRNPPYMLFGAYDGSFPNDLTGLVELEDRLRFRFPIISFYNAWGDKPEQQFPFRMTDTIDRLGSVPMITWEPWVTEFDMRTRRLPGRDEREYATLAAIAKGDYDFYVVPWAESAAQFGKPIFLRFAHAMNDPYRYPWGPQNGNRPDDYIAAWRRLHGIFEKAGAKNIIWVWSPNITMEWINLYYPGDQYVDWIGGSALNYGTVANWSRWWSLKDMLSKSYATLSKINKPMMICELGTLSQGGDMLQWYQQAFHDLDEKYARVRAVVFFNDTRDVTMSSWPLNWSVMQDGRAADYVARELSRLSQM